MDGQLSIAEIIIPNGRRPVHNVKALAESIREIGLLNPITVTADRHLVAGRNRLEACRSLGWESIPVRVIELDDLHTELAEIDENLIRNELPALERAEQLRRRKAVYEAMHPETRNGGDRRSSAAKTKRERTDEQNAGAAFCSFAVDTSVKTGRSPRAIWSDVQIAENLTSEVKEAIRDTPLADHKEALVELSRVEKEEQQAVASLAIEKGLSIAQAHREVATQAAGNGQPETNGHPRREAKGVICAQEAINCLKRIPPNDPLRKRGFQIVADWMRHNK